MPKIIKASDFYDTLQEKYPHLDRKTVGKICNIVFNRFVDETQNGFYIQTVNKNLFFATSVSIVNKGKLKKFNSKREVEISSYKKQVNFLKNYEEQQGK